MGAQLTRALTFALSAVWLVAATAGADDRPMIGEPIAEGSSSTMTLLVTDSSGLGVTPRDVLCWVDDRVTTRRLYGPVAVTPAQPMAIALPPQANQIATESADLEEHILTCQARYPAACIPVPTPGANCTVKVGGVRFNVQNERVVVGGSTAQPSPAPTPTP